LQFQLKSSYHGFLHFIFLFLYILPSAAAGMAMLKANTEWTWKEERGVGRLVICPPLFPWPDKPLPITIITSPPTWLSLQFHTQLPQLKSEYKPQSIMPRPGISSQCFDYYEVLINSLAGFVGLRLRRALRSYKYTAPIWGGVGM